MVPESQHDPLVSCGDPEHIVGALNSLIPSVSPELRRQFNLVKVTLLQRFGTVGLHARTNGRRVSEILETEWEDCNPEPIDSGEIEGVRYKLYESPEQAF